ncbi:beta-lactamase [Loktanella sp. TSTF-M6]|uniref:Beta-lactamase n=1 Tax=Loktanella gaetbuli TaxID=2881335 RepID=A0ABS8BXP7_9RHOB|nr:class C beta-lactamase [Loktanella gaetbuli]MCB5200515.1 beta-lactamase [Loktanella gaetbuli]
MKTLNPAAAVLVSLPTTLVAQDLTDAQVTDMARDSFAPVIAEFDIPGLVVGITFRGQQHFYATGLAAREGEVAASPETIFELGSISKIFTASLAALAEQQGVIDLESPVSGSLPDLKGSAFDDIKLANLATHVTGGLPLQVPDAVQNVPALVDWLAEWQPPQPGTRSYSNVSIGLLGYITAEALGMPYAQAAEDILFPAMGLTSTFVNVPDNEMDRYAYGYDRNTDAPIRVNPGVLADEAYGVKSTARDMVRLLDLELGHGDAVPALMAALERTREGRAETAYYTQDMVWEQYPWPADVTAMEAGNGYDFILSPQHATAITPPLPPQQNVILNKTGATNGFGGYVTLLPGEDLGIVVLANRNYPNETRVRATYDLIEDLLAAQE